MIHHVSPVGLTSEIYLSVLDWIGIRCALFDQFWSEFDHRSGSK